MEARPGRALLLVSALHAERRPVGSVPPGGRRVTTTGIPLRSIQRWLRKLDQQGYVSVRERDGVVQIAILRWKTPARRQSGAKTTPTLAPCTPLLSRSAERERVNRDHDTSRRGIVADKELSTRLIEQDRPRVWISPYRWPRNSWKRDQTESSRSIWTRHMGEQYVTERKHT